jgi:CheY-like chemotaxis protein
MEKDKNAKLEKLKILLAEDDPTGVKLSERILKRLGHDVYRVYHGAEAVSFCRNNPDVDLIIMDIMMPLMDGIEATRQIRQFNKEVILIALSVNVFPDDLDRYIEAGFNNYISKPFFIADLEGLINQYFRKD